MTTAVRMTGMESGLLRKRLHDEYGFAARQVQLSHRAARTGGQHAPAARVSLADLPGETVHLVGHSLGGVLALNTLKRFPETRPGRVVCLGSPLRGSLTAGLPFGEELLGVTMREAVLSGGLTEYQGSREVTVIAGTLSVGLGLVIENLPSPNDGTVSVAETQLPGDQGSPGGVR